MGQEAYFSLFDQICRSNGWTLGQDKGELVVSIPQDDGQMRGIEINEFQDSTGQAAIRLWTPVAASGQVPAEQAMQVNSALPHGHLADKDGTIVMTATRILNMTNQADLTNLLNVMVYYATFYARHYSQ